MTGAAASRARATRTSFKSKEQRHRMTLVLKGVMQSPVTPLKEDFSPDYETFERLVDFHVRTGATAISWPHHKAESHNLTIAERKALAEVAIKAVARRVPVSIHVSALALEGHVRPGAPRADMQAPTPSSRSRRISGNIRRRRSTTTSSARHGDRSAADRLQFAELSRRRRVHRRTDRAADRAAAELHRHEGGELQQREVLRDPARGASAAADFAMIAGVEYLLPSVSLGGAGSYSSAGAICPNLCVELYESCAPANGTGRASCNTSCRSSGSCSGISIRRRSRAAA